MRYLTPGVLLAFAAMITFFCFYGNDSYSQVLTLQKSLREQRERNAAVAGHLMELKREIAGLQRDNRVLEKAARNELGLARPGELVFFFEHKDESGK